MFTVCPVFCMLTICPLIFVCSLFKPVLNTILEVPWPWRLIEVWKWPGCRSAVGT